MGYSRIIMSVQFSSAKQYPKESGKERPTETESISATMSMCNMYSFKLWGNMACLPIGTHIRALAEIGRQRDAYYCCSRWCEWVKSGNRLKESQMHTYTQPEHVWTMNSRPPRTLLFSLSPSSSLLYAMLWNRCRVLKLRIASSNISQWSVTTCSVENRTELFTIQPTTTCTLETR